MRLADAADGREVPGHLVGQYCLGNQLLAVEAVAGVIPLAARVDNFITVQKLLGAQGARVLLHALHHGLWHAGALVIQGVGLARALGRQKAIEIPLLGQSLVVADQLAYTAVGQLGAAQAPVAPAALPGQ